MYSLPFIALGFRSVSVALQQTGLGLLGLQVIHSTCAVFSALTAARGDSAICLADSPCCATWTLMASSPLHQLSNGLLMPRPRPGRSHRTDPPGLALQDMTAISATWETELFFIVYLVLAQVMLLNLLIAMLSNTYDSIAAEALDQWRFTRVETILEFSEQVRSSRVTHLPR